MNLTTRKYWDEGYRGLDFSPMPFNYPIVKEIYNSIKPTNSKSVFEVGCFPGRFLYHFGNLGYELNGIDRTQYLPKMVNWLKSSGFNIGVFKKGDFFSLKVDKKYDVVFSSGFIEHFENYEEVIRLHANLVKNDGYIFITTPNFSGSIQRGLHTFFDKDNILKHYLPAMNPEKWDEILRSEGFDVIKQGFFGGFDFWTANPKSPIFKKIVEKIITFFMPIRWVPDSPSYSPEIILIGRKK